MKPEQGDIVLIIDRISRQDDEKALKELFDIYYGKLIEVANFFVSDHASAQDVVSEVFIRLWKNRTNLSTIKNINSYLYVAVKRQSLNHIRERKARMTYRLYDHESLAIVESVDPEKLMLSEEFLQVLNQAIQDLPSKCRLIYSMVKDDNMKYKEVTETMDISIKTVEMHVGKALKRIKLAFENYI